MRVGFRGIIRRHLSIELTPKTIARLIETLHTNDSSRGQGPRERCEQEIFIARPPLTVNKAQRQSLPEYIVSVMLVSETPSEGTPFSTVPRAPEPQAHFINDTRKAIVAKPPKNAALVKE